MKIKNLLRTAALTAATLMLWTGVSWGQVTLSGTSYSENFDNISSGLPTGWTVRTAASSTVLGTAQTLTTTATVWNNTAGAFKNFASADGLTSASDATAQNASTDRTLGFRQTGTVGDPGGAFVFQIANTTGFQDFSLSFKLQSLDVASARTTTWVVDYAFGASPTSFTPIATTPALLTTGNLSFTNSVVTVNFSNLLNNSAENVWIRIVALTASTGSGSRPSTGIDDVNLTWAVFADTEAPVPTFSPLNGSTDVAIDVIPTITFDEAIRNIDDSEITELNVADLISFTDPSKGAVPFTATIDGDKKVITITPSAALANEVEYTVAVAPVEDALGNGMASPSGASFTTIASTTPVLTLTSTHTGPYYAGDDITVTWDSENIDFVNVDFQSSLGIWINMALEVPAANGTATFNIFEGDPYSPASKVRVRNAADAMQVSESPAFKIRAVAQNLLTVRGYAVNTEFRYDGEAVVTFSRPAGTPGWNQKFIQDETAAILIHENPTVITTPYVIGDGMSGLVAKMLAPYNQLIEIAPLEDPGAPSSTGNEIIPEVKTLAEITSADQSKLVKVNGVTFSAGGIFAVNTNYTITDASKGSLTFRTSFPATEVDYIGQPIPTNPLDLVMLVGQFNANIQLTSRSLADFTMYYQLTVAAGPNGQVSPVNGFYQLDAEVEVAATPNFGYKFLNWTDATMAVVSTENPYTVIMPSANLTLTANFEAIPAVTNFPWFDGFEDGMNNWSVVDADGSGVSWALGTDDGHSGSNYAYHIWGNEDDDEEGWLVSPQLVLPGGWPGMVLKFWSYNVDASYYGKNSVLISTGSGNPADGQFVEVWSPTEVPNEEWVETAINLNTYSGQPIYIAFKYEGNFAHAWILDDISIAQFEQPQISPEGAIFSISQPADVEFDINWGSETEITTLYYRYWDESTQQDVEEPMVLGTDYTIVDNTLTISTTFILDNYSNNGLNFRAEFGMGSESQFYIEVVYSLIPTITPTAVNYDLTNPGDVFTTIVWAGAESITSVSVDGTPLVLNTDYRIQTGQLFINNSYLSTVLTATGNTFDALITFNTADEATLTVTAITSGVINATISPQFVEYTVMPEYDDFTITWNAATAVTGIHVFVTMQSYFMEMDLVEGTQYVVTDNGNGTANLRVFFGGDKSIKESQQIMEVVATVSFDAGAPANFFITMIETYYELTVNVNPVEAGWVNGVWDGYQAGEEVNLNANTNFGYVFINWTDAEGVELSTDQNYIFTMPANDLTINANFSPIFNVTFNIVDAESNPINDAIVTFDGVANEPGNYMFFEIMPGEYSYSVAKDGFVTATGTVTVIDADLYVEVTLYVPTYTVTFNVIDEVSAPIADAIITFDGTTAAAGEYVFTDLIAGAYDYTVAKDGFVDVTGTATVVNADLTIDITMIPVGVNTNTLTSLNAYPNPFSNQITISNPSVVSRVVVANLIGQVVMDVRTNGVSTVETAKLSAGIYLVTFEAANGESVVRKMVKK